MPSDILYIIQRKNGNASSNNNNERWEKIKWENRTFSVMGHLSLNLYEGQVVQFDFGVVELLDNDSLFLDSLQRLEITQLGICSGYYFHALVSIIGGVDISVLQWQLRWGLMVQG